MIGADHGGMNEILDLDGAVALANPVAQNVEAVQRQGGAKAGQGHGGILSI